MSLLNHQIRPCIGAETAMPYTAEDIDNLPQEISVRVWATILQLREHASRKTYGGDTRDGANKGLEL